MNTNKPIGHGSIEERKAMGAHYTPKTLSDFVAKQILNHLGPRKKTEKVRVLDPAVGDGQLLLSILEQLTTAGFSNIVCTGFDTDPNAINFSSSRITNSYPKVSLDLRCEDFLDFALSHNFGQLFAKDQCFFDLAISNPPYIRTQVMGAQRARQISQQFNLSGRSDIYYAFICGIAMLIKPGGIAGIIVSNRFMTTKSGTSARRSIIDNFQVLHVWDLGDTRLFEAAVLPSVLILRGKNTINNTIEANFTSIYSTEDGDSSIKCTNAIEALNKEGLIILPNGCHYIVQQGKLSHGDRSDGVWRIATEESEKWLSKVAANTYCKFGDVGKVKVGIKTTADPVFIRSNWEELPKDKIPELLIPLTTHHIARRFKAKESDDPKKVLYTHTILNGKRVAVDLRKFPRAYNYLSTYRDKLSGRKYVLEAGRKWFEIWVPQNPEVWSLPKVVFRDISEEPTFWMDLSGSVVNGDCYWIVNNSSKRMEMLWLILAVGNSSFIRVFYDHKFRNRLYSSRRRFMTQYVDQFPLPSPDTHIGKQIIQLSKQIYKLTPSKQAKSLESKLDNLVWKAFGFSS